jgi:hypothetical protein
MIQYKLIKRYPGHLILGETHCSDKSTHWYGTIFYDAYPDFWQKLEELDYNKPLLSLNDLLSVWGSKIEDYKTSPLFHSFLELAKSKL